jgi:hypothetical protein
VNIRHLSSKVTVSQGIGEAGMKKKKSSTQHFATHLELSCFTGLEEFFMESATQFTGSGSLAFE